MSDIKKKGEHQLHRAQLVPHCPSDHWLCHTQQALSWDTDCPVISPHTEISKAHGAMAATSVTAVSTVQEGGTRRQLSSQLEVRG